MTVVYVSLGIVLLFLLIVIESVRRGSLETKYSILWIITCVVLGVLSAGKPLLDFIADILNVYYAPSVLFLFGLLFSLIMLFDMTRKISQLNHKLVMLTQEYTLLKKRYEEDHPKEKKGNEQ
jgi:hypothetical protein